MKTLAYPPVYVAVFALQTLAAATVLLGRFQSPSSIATLTLFFGGVYSVALYGGYALSRKGYVPGNGAQLAQLAVTGAIVLVWFMVVGYNALFVVFALALLLARDVFLTTRRALYFDLGVLLTLFYDAVGTDKLPYRWPIAIAFLLGLVFLLIADYTDRRLAYVKVGETRALTAIFPGLRNAAFATVLTLVIAALIYVLMPQPKALELALLPDRGPPQSLSEWLGQHTPAGAQDAKGPGNLGGAAGTKAGKTGGSTGAEKLDLGASGGSIEKGGGLSTSEAGKEKSTSPPEPPPPLVLFVMRADRPLYLRTHAFVVPGPDAWYEAPMAAIATPHRTLARKDAPPGGVIQRYNILEPLDRRIPMAYALAHIEFPTTLSKANIDLLMEADESLAAGTKYAAVSTVHYLGEHASGYAQKAPPEAYSYLPDTVMRLARNLAVDRAQGRSIASEKAIALERFVRDNYKPGVFKANKRIDPTLQFLFEDGGGGSRQFAGALAVLLRSIGIPSRIMAGYRARRLNPITQSYEIWATDRHHWVEAYIEGGWVTFEPSPWATLPARANPESWFEAAREYVRLAREDPVDVLLAGGTKPQIPQWYLALVLVWGWFATFGKLLLLAAIALTAAAWRWRTWSLPFRDAIDRWKLRHGSHADPRALVRRSYEAVERMAARRRFARSHSENHIEYLERLARERPHLGMPCRTLARHFGAARYGLALREDDARDAAQAARVIAELIDERQPA